MALRKKHLIVCASVFHTDMEKSEKIERRLKDSIVTELSCRSYRGDVATLTTLLNDSPTCSINDLQRAALGLRNMERNGYCPHIVIIVEPDDIISYVVFLYALFFAHLGLKSVHILTPHYENRNILCFPHYMATASILCYSQSESGLVNYQDTAKRLVDTIGRYHQFSLPEYLADYQSFLQEYDNNYNKQLTQPILYEEMRNNPNHTIIAINMGQSFFLCDLGLRI